MTAQKIDIAPEHWDGVFGPSSCLVIDTTVDKQGNVNAAAHATATRVSHAPVDIAITVNEFSHTWANLQETGEFVVNVVPFELDVLEKVRVVGLPFEKGINELERAGLTALPSKVVGPPRVEECRAHFECKVEWTRPWGHRVMVLGRVVAVTMNEDCFDPRGLIRWDRLKPTQFAGAPYDGNFVKAYEPQYAELKYDGPQDWRGDLGETIKRSGVDWGAATANLNAPNVLES